MISEKEKLNRLWLGMSDEKLKEKMAEELEAELEACKKLKTDTFSNAMRTTSVRQLRRTVRKKKENCKQIDKILSRRRETITTYRSAAI